MARTFAEYAAAAKREPFAFPMPEGDPVMIAQPSLDTESKAFTAANAGTTYGAGLLAGLAVLAGEENGKRIADAYGPLPPSLLAAVVDDMRQHFGQDKAQG